ncbi:ATP-dependent DNA helicase MPH1 [Magnaporthiopsis poae ATCC 64411]|uniref:ATP-dependent DNA helicase n=1 Tax=Magnaporthiopsis poae (strain ATCC 64411 / 73-15) TaxID=644358 RepID=A0A0C4DTE5_MAGP6|nr:ATP-dependent DNA helicase MPH1 [Magnaporthiopsis poae ATCC 64411]
MASDCDPFDDDVCDEDLMALDDLARTASSAAAQQPRSTINSVRQSLHTGHRPTATTAAALSSSRSGEGLDDLDGLPSDAFDSSPEPEVAPRPVAKQPRVFHQTTLSGQPLADNGPSQAQRPGAGRVYRGDMPTEPPTHHELDNEALKTWVYPMNLGAIRDYQFSIVKNGLFSNTLVALPTGLGKTFIAATVMLNYFRWTRNAKIVFVAPTKPLASQQVEACLNIAGIPRSAASLLTGEVKPALREEEWECRRLFFMTPQTLMNDLSKGYADPKKIVLLVVDEAHRATGDYAYVKVIDFIRRFSKSFRVLALTATPGSTVEGVQAVIDNLGVSHVEIRTEESIDIRSYVHSREIDRVVLEPSDEMLRLSELFSQALKPLTTKISQMNIYYGRDPLSITTYGLMKARQDWLNGAGRHANQGTKMMLMAIFTILQGLAHAIKLLNFHGIRPFYDSLAAFRAETEEKGQKGSKYKRQILADPGFQEMMDIASNWLKLPDFIGHPKLTHLCDTLLNHFMDAGEGSSTRVIVFSEYRDSAEEIVRVLNTHKPMVNASLFVGQADSKKSEGMKQKQQIETIEKFRSGTFNVLVATSIGEEGLDIGQVDLIICYDASSSPIRMLQRMGRTGRKRAGKITLLLMKGREEDKYNQAQDNYEKMQQLICEGSRFNFRYDLSSRIVPRDVKPEVDKRVVEIPIENTQNTSLPEPKSRAARAKKPSKKKFNMPDGVQTGFTLASMLGKVTGAPQKQPTQAKMAFKAVAQKPEQPKEEDDLAPIPKLENVLLNSRQVSELDRQYRNLPFNQKHIEEISMPSLTAHPTLQRTLRPSVHLKHGSYTRRCVRLFKKLSEPRGQPSEKIASNCYLDIPVPPFGDEPGASLGNKRASPPESCNAEQQPPKRRKPSPKPKVSAVSEYLSDADDTPLQEDFSDDDLASFISYGEENGQAQGASPSSLSTDDGFNLTAPSRKASSGQSAAPPRGRAVPSSASSVASTLPAAASKPYFVPAELPGTQPSEDDDVPPLETLIGGSSGRKQSTAQDGPAHGGNSNGRDSSGGGQGRQNKRRARRPFLPDSESD